MQPNNQVIDEQDDLNPKEIKSTLSTYMVPLTLKHNIPVWVKQFLNYADPVGGLAKYKVYKDQPIGDSEHNPVLISFEMDKSYATPSRLIEAIDKELDKPYPPNAKSATLRQFLFPSEMSRREEILRTQFKPKAALKEFAIPPQFHQLIKDIIGSAETMDVYAVGGFVRDLYMGAEPKDLDIVIDSKDPQGAVKFAETLLRHENPNITPEEIKKKIIGQNDKTFTCKVLLRSGELDIAVPREESYNKESREPDVVSITDLDTDAKRRDLTINAMRLKLTPDWFVNKKSDETWNMVKSEDIIDPTNGKDDIDSHTLRVPNPDRKIGTYTDDPLRALRIIRIAAQKGFKIDPETEQAVVDAVKLGLKKIDAESIQKELSTILKAGNPRFNIEWLLRTGVLEYAVPAFGNALRALHIPHDSPHHAETIIEHVLMGLGNDQETIDSFKNLKPEVQLAWLMHDLGKPITKKFKKDKPDHATYIDHHRHSGMLVPTISNELRLSNDIADKVKKLVEHHMDAKDFVDIMKEGKSWEPWKLKEWIYQMLKERIDLSDLHTLFEMDAKHRIAPNIDEDTKALKTFLQHTNMYRNDVEKYKPLVSATQIKERYDIDPSQPSDWIGNILDFERIEQFKHPGITVDELWKSLDNWLGNKSRKNSDLHVYEEEEYETKPGVKQKRFKKNEFGENVIKEKKSLYYPKSPKKINSWLKESNMDYIDNVKQTIAGITSMSPQLLNRLMNAYISRGMAPEQAKQRVEELQKLDPSSSGSYMQLIVSIDTKTPVLEDNERLVTIQKLLKFHNTYRNLLGQWRDISRFKTIDEFKTAMLDAEMALGKAIEKKSGVGRAQEFFDRDGINETIRRSMDPDLKKYQFLNKEMIQKERERREAPLNSQGFLTKAKTDKEEAMGQGEVGPAPVDVGETKEEIENDTSYDTDEVKNRERLMDIAIDSLGIAMKTLPKDAQDKLLSYLTDRKIITKTLEAVLSDKSGKAAKMVEDKINGLSASEKAEVATLQRQHIDNAIIHERAERARKIKDEEELKYMQKAKEEIKKPLPITNPNDKLNFYKEQPASGPLTPLQKKYNDLWERTPIAVKNIILQGVPHHVGTFIQGVGIKTLPGQTGLHEREALVLNMYTKNEQAAITDMFNNKDWRFDITEKNKNIPETIVPPTEPGKEPPTKNVAPRTLEQKYTHLLNINKAWPKVMKAMMAIDAAERKIKESIKDWRDDILTDFSKGMPKAHIEYKYAKVLPPNAIGEIIKEGERIQFMNSGFREMKKKLKRYLDEGHNTPLAVEEAKAQFKTALKNYERFIPDVDDFLYKINTGAIT